MAVTVEGTPNIVVDGDYSIVEVGSIRTTVFRPAPGRNLWDVFPGSKPLFQPYYDEAWTTGEPVEFLQFYSGRLFRVRAVPEGPRLLLFGETLKDLDTLTLDGLRASLDATVALIDEWSGAARRERLKDSFRLVEGGVDERVQRVSRPQASRDAR